MVAGWFAQIITAQQATFTASVLADHIATSIERTIVNTDQMFQTIMDGTPNPASQDLNPQQRDALLTQRAPKNPQIVFLEVLDAAGNVLASLAPTSERKNWASRDYFVALSGRPARDLFIGMFGQKSETTVGMLLSHRITSRDGSFAGVIVEGVRLAFLGDILKQYAANENETITLLREDGLVVARHPFALPGVGQMIDPTSPFYTFMHSGRTPITVHDQSDGERRYAFHQVGDLPLYVAISSPTNGFHLPALSW